MTLVSLAILGLTICATSFVAGIFGMAGGMILLGVLLIYFDVAVAMVVFSIVQFAANGWRAMLWRRCPSTVPEQPAGAHQIDRAERQDEGARPLPEAMVGHALDQEGRERGAGHRDQDGEHIGQG